MRGDGEKAGERERGDIGMNRRENWTSEAKYKKILNEANAGYWKGYYANK